jgi:hypothetical protein
MEPLPDVLENLGLLMPKVALLYALGHRDELRNEGLPAERYTDEEIDALIKLWFEQPGRLQIPARPLLMSGKLIELRSNVLGCKLICTVESADQSVFLAEAMLGATEAFLATSMRVQASAQSRESPTCAPVS